jgi:hypothetical protein
MEVDSQISRVDLKTFYSTVYTSKIVKRAIYCPVTTTYRGMHLKRNLHLTTGKHFYSLKCCPMKLFTLLHTSLLEAICTRKLIFINNGFKHISPFVCCLFDTFVNGDVNFINANRLKSS